MSERERERERQTETNRNRDSEREREEREWVRQRVRVRVYVYVCMRNALFKFHPYEQTTAHQAMTLSLLRHQGEEAATGCSPFPGGQKSLG